MNKLTKAILDDDVVMAWGEVGGTTVYVATKNRAKKIRIRKKRLPQHVISNTISRDVDNEINTSNSLRELLKYFKPNDDIKKIASNFEVKEI